MRPAIARTLAPLDYFIPAETYSRCTPGWCRSITESSWTRYRSKSVSLIREPPDITARCRSRHGCEIFIVAIARAPFAALFHNNCMYLAHHLLTLAHDYRDQFSKSLQKLNLTFADQVTVLRDVGSRCFLEHMRYQRNIIFDIIKDSGSYASTWRLRADPTGEHATDAPFTLITGFTSLGQTPELHPSTERALRQCIRQLELLKTVWLDVLPVNVYCKAVGGLDPILVAVFHAFSQNVTFLTQFLSR